MVLTKEDLEEIDKLLAKRLEPLEQKVKSIKQKVKSVKEELETGLATINMRLGAPEADLLAKCVTVAIKVGNNPPDGHGLLIKVGEVHYLLSAAHVIVDLESGSHVTIEWAGKAIASASVTKLYLDKRYVEKGTHDISFVEIGKLEVKDGKNIEKALAEVSVKFPEKDSELDMGNAAIGHGLVFLRGQLVHIDGQSNRAMYQAVSVPGCSGCPLLFDSSKKFVSVVHGNCKHCHHSVAIEDASHLVFADVATLKDYKFQLAKDEKKHLLRYAEGLTEDLAAKSGEKFMLGSAECPRFLVQFALAMFESLNLIDPQNNVLLEKKRLFG